MKTGGVIGLGTIGGGVAQCLQRAGQLAAVYDVNPAAADQIPNGPAVSASPRELSEKSDCVLIAVLNGEQTLSVLGGPDGVLAADNPAKLVILLSTVAMDELAEAQKLCAAAGVEILDCGVTNGPKAAQNGLICLVGGSDEAVTAAKPIFDGFAQEIIHMGPPNAGMAAKIARNTTYFGGLRAGYEGAVLAKHYGVDLNQMRKALDGDPDFGGGMTGTLMLMVRPDPEGNEQETAGREYHHSLMIKDLDVAIAEAAKFGVRLPMVELLKEYGRSTVGLEHPLGVPLKS